MNKLTAEEQKILQRVLATLAKRGVPFNGRRDLSVRLMTAARILYRRQGTFTICMIAIEEPDGFDTAIGASKRSPRDPLHPEIGNALAFRRALEHLVENEFGVLLGNYETVRQPGVVFVEEAATLSPAMQALIRLAKGPYGG